MARNVNGVVKGNLMSKMSVKNFKFDLTPLMAKKTSIDILSEIKRLYLTTKKNKNGKDELSLLSRDTIDDPGKLQNYLLNMEGCFGKQTTVCIEKMRNKDAYRISCKIREQQIVMEEKLDTIKAFLHDQGILF